MNIRSCCFALIGLCLVSNGAAQNSNEALHDATVHALATSAGEAPMRSVLSSYRPGLELRALKDDSTVSLRWGTPIKDEHRFIAFIATVPLDKDDDNTKLATLDGLSKATTLEFKHNWFFDDPPLIKGIMQRTGFQTDFTPRSTILTERLENLSGNTAAARKNGASIQSSAEGAARKTNVFSASATVGHKKFEFLDPISLADQTTGKAVYSGRVSYARYIWAQSAVVMDFDYQDALEDGAKKSFVLPADTNGFQEIKTGTVGAPSRSVKRLYSVELRKRLTLQKRSGSIGVKVTYDQVEDVFGIKVPIYIIQDKAESSAGGIELSWVDHKDKEKTKFSIGLMIGAGLKLEPF